MKAIIPKRIIQTDKSADLPLLARASVATIKLNNPNFEYIFFDDNSVEEFIDNHFPMYRHVFDSFPVLIQRYDFFRYLAIFHFGGFYFDTDVLLASSLSDILQFGCVFPFERLTWSDYLRDQYGMDWEIGNYAFGAAAGHPFIGAVIENCVRAQKDHAWRDAMTRSLPRPLRDDLFVIYSTGPGLVSRTLAEYNDSANPVEVLFPENVCDKEKCWNLFGHYGVHLGGGSWRPRHGAWRKRLLNFFGRRNETRAIKLAERIGPKRSLNAVRKHVTIP